MQAVIETHAFRRAVKDAEISEDEVWAIKLALSANPEAGVLIKGTGGARKVRFAARGKGKSGGYRVISFYAAEDVPVFLLDVYAKGEKINLTQAECNELKEILATVADEWRASARDKVAQMAERTR